MCGANVGFAPVGAYLGARIGPTLESATRPKLSFAAFLSLRTDARPTPIAIINGKKRSKPKKRPECGSKATEFAPNYMMKCGVVAICNTAKAM